MKIYYIAAFVMGMAIVDPARGLMHDFNQRPEPPLVSSADLAKQYPCSGCTSLSKMVAWSFDHEPKKWGVNDVHVMGSKQAVSASISGSQDVSCSYQPFLTEGKDVSGTYLCVDKSSSDQEDQAMIWNAYKRLVSRMVDREILE